MCKKKKKIICSSVSGVHKITHILTQRENVLCIIVSRQHTERGSIHVYMYPHTYTVRVCGVYQFDSSAYFYTHTLRKACTFSPKHLYRVWCVRKKESVHNFRIHRHGNTKITYKHTYICKSIHTDIYPHSNIASIYIYICIPTH